MPFQFRRLEIPELIAVEAEAFIDDRGFFIETYKSSEFCKNGICEAFVQDNYSHSTKGVLRGLHYQIHPHAQGKLVTVIRGEIFDVAVDIRHGSPTYGSWIGTALQGTSQELLYVPVGFAHGFCTLSEEAEVVYKVTEEYSPEADRGIRWNDPDLAIDWPVVEPRLSTKDTGLPLLRDAEKDFKYEEKSA